MVRPGLAKEIGAAFVDREHLIGAVERYLVKKGVDEDEYFQRGLQGIHPSEMAHEHWCHRATYYRLAGVEADPTPRVLAFEMAFEVGNDAHHKWQQWFREMGVLRGQWLCLNCQRVFEAISPQHCPKCKIDDPQMIIYKEVPLLNEEYMIVGSADGDVVFEEPGKIIEVKTIGTGTVRIEAPKILARHTFRYEDVNGKIRTGVDWADLWFNIRRPFPSHIRQGMIYLFCLGRKEIVYIYDPKFITSKPKEFELRFRKDVIEDVLDRCLVVRRSLDNQRPPKRPLWAEAAAPACKKCPFRSTCYDRSPSHPPTSRPDRQALGRPRRRPSRTAEERNRSAGPARFRFAEAANQSHRDQ